jgi:hypothetical protein
MNLQKDIVKSIRTNADMMLTCIKCIEKIDAELTQEKRGPAAKHLKFRIEQLMNDRKEWGQKLEENRKRFNESVEMLGRIRGDKPSKIE